MDQDIGGGGLTTVHLALAALLEHPERLDLERRRFSSAQFSYLIYPPSRGSTLSADRTLSAQSDPEAEAETQAGIDHLASKPYRQMEDQQQDVICALPPGLAHREWTFNVVKSRWQEQGIWNDRWPSTGPWVKDLWKHQEPFHTLTNSTSPPPKRRKRNPLTVNQRAQAKCDREASRPIHQFLWQLHKERDRIINEHTDGDSPGAFSLDINDTAYESIKSTWVRRGIWDIKWGILPGMSWKHEWPLPWQTDADPGPAVAPSYSTGRKEPTILLRSEDAKGTQVSILAAAAAPTHLPEVLGNSEVEDVAYVADDRLPSPTQGFWFSAMDGKAQDEVPTCKYHAPTLYSSYSGDYEHGNNSKSMETVRQTSTHPVSRTTALAKTSGIGRAAKSISMSKAPANGPNAANTKNGRKEGVERPLIGGTIPVEGDSLAVAGNAPHQEAAIKPRRKAALKGETRSLSSATPHQLSLVLSLHPTADNQPKRRPARDRKAKKHEETATRPLAGNALGSVRSPKEDESLPRKTFSMVQERKAVAKLSNNSRRTPETVAETRPPRRRSKRLQKDARP
ncbi:MAG: hypothetical protein Q9178_003857 [Gyalolechia marmorata]